MILRVTASLDSTPKIKQICSYFSMFTSMLPLLLLVTTLWCNNNTNVYMPAEDMRFHIHGINSTFFISSVLLMHLCFQAYVDGGLLRVVIISFHKLG